MISEQQILKNTLKSHCKATDHITMKKYVEIENTPAEKNKNTS
jgi:hypothetical protein